MRAAHPGVLRNGWVFQFHFCKPIFEQIGFGQWKAVEIESFVSVIFGTARGHTILDHVQATQDTNAASINLNYTEQ